MSRRRHPCRAFTIVELMVGLVLVASFAATAAPFVVAARNNAHDAQRRVEGLSDLQECLRAFGDDARAAQSAFIDGECVLLLGSSDPVCWRRRADGTLARTTETTHRCVSRRIAAFSPSRGPGTLELAVTLADRLGGHGPEIRTAFALGGSR